MESLSDLIISKIQEAENKKNEPVHQPKKDIDEQLKDVYTKVGIVLSRYKSGKLPKALKVIPTLKNWETILDITNPAEWTPNSTFQVTRIFVSNLNPSMTQIFLEKILLPKVRNDIINNKKVNPHLYMALKKAIYKPAAFFKGIIIPVCEDETTTLREANIISSVMAKISIPGLHSAACLFKLCELPYTGARSIFMRVLLDKKHALPSRVIDSMVTYFIRTANEEPELHVLWYQSFLVFVQRYKADLTLEQIKQLQVVSGSHEDISPEIIRELEVSETLAASTMNID